MLLDEQKTENYIKKMMYYYDIPGLAAGAGTNEKLLYNRSFGYKSIKTKEALQENAVFHMASLTKLFVGTSIMQLYEKGLLDIDETAGHYLPYFKLKDKRYSRITVRHILSHTSGIPDIEDYEWDKPQFDDEALERYVKSLENLALLWDPGTKFMYSNIAYEILGDIIAKASGETFESYVEKNIFEPLKMHDSSLMTFKRDRAALADPHVKNDEKKVIVSDIFPYNRIHAPSSTLTSTVKDIFRWAAVHLNRGEFDGIRILNENTHNLFLQKQADINAKEQICLSWFARERRGLRLYGHEGSDVGFRSSFCIIPELNWYISVHANLDGAPTKKILHGILDMLLGYEPEI